MLGVVIAIATASVVAVPSAQATTVDYGKTYKSWLDYSGRTHTLFSWIRIDYTNHQVRPYAENQESFNQTSFFVATTLFQDGASVQFEGSGGHLGTWRQTTRYLQSCGGGHNFYASAYARDDNAYSNSGNLFSGTANTAC